MCVMLACPCSTGATRYVQKHAGTQAAPAAQQCHKMRHKQCASVSIPHRLATKVSSSAETLPVPAASVVATAVRATSAADSVPAMAAALPGLKPYLEAEAGGWVQVLEDMSTSGWVQVLEDTCRPSPMAMVYTRRTVQRRSFPHSPAKPQQKGTKNDKVAVSVAVFPVHLRHEVASKILAVFSRHRPSSATHHHKHKRYSLLTGAMRGHAHCTHAVLAHLAVDAKASNTWAAEICANQGCHTTHRVHHNAACRGSMGG